MQTPEGKLKDEVKSYLKSLGSRCSFFMPVPNGFGKKGLGDIIGCVDGRFFTIETKIHPRLPTPWQVKYMLEVKASGGIAFVAYDLEEVKARIF